ncbi:hypothetical protein Q1695_015222 [Nippostrongylus brasiliensis]|nr:hypothetical protein Q1695_015222 [Nippostrongylus brasiliensis]
MREPLFEDHRYLMKEKRVRGDQNRERVEEERWTRGRPVLNTRHAPVSFERVPVQRIVEDYRRSDYRYDTDP